MGRSRGRRLNPSCIGTDSSMGHLWEPALVIHATGPCEGVLRLAHDRYAILLNHRDSPDAQTSLPVTTLVTFSRVPSQKSCLAAPGSVQYVDALPKQDYCSPLFHRFAARTLLQRCVVAPGTTASALLHAVLVSKKPALIQRVRHFIYLFSTIP
jgi:hypothetical protein